MTATSQIISIRAHFCRAQKTVIQLGISLNAEDLWLTKNKVALEGNIVTATNHFLSSEIL